MATINKVGNRWRVRWDEHSAGQRKQRQRTFPTETEAKQFAAYVTLNHGQTNTTVAATPLYQYTPTWLASKRRLAPTTRTRYETVLAKNILPHIGHIPIGNLTHAHIEDLVDTLTDTLAPRTVHKAISVLSAVCDRAIKERGITINPCLGVDLPISQDAEMLWLTPAELERLCSHMKPEAALLTRFLAYTGLRWGEATALLASDIDPLRGRVRVEKSRSRDGIVGPTKTRRNRWVPLETSLLAEVTEVIRDSGKPADSLLFLTPGGRPWRPSNFRRDHFGPAKKAAEIHPGLRIHDLRHTCATWLLNEGHDVWKVAQWLGHTSTATTERVYAHLIDSSLDPLAVGLGGLRGRVGDGPATVAKVRAL